jgi:hypothetical protein
MRKLKERELTLDKEDKKFEDNEYRNAEQNIFKMN